MLLFKMLVQMYLIGPVEKIYKFYNCIYLYITAGPSGGQIIIP